MAVSSTWSRCRRRSWLLAPGLSIALYASACPVLTAQAAVGDITEYPVPNANIPAIASGPDGNLWFTEYVAAKIGRITPAGKINEFPTPHSS
jgi:streptogramin lyase